MSELSREHLRKSWKAWISHEIEPVGPAWLQWVWTVLFSVVVAIAFTVLSFAFNAVGGGKAWMSPATWLRWFGYNLAVSLVIGCLIHTLFALTMPLIGTARIRAWSLARRAVYFTSVPIVGVMIGWPLGVWLFFPGAERWFARLQLGNFVGIFLFSLLISFVFFQIFAAKAKQAEAEKREAQARLRLLQAQIEPHFLFNTLANVLALIEHDTPRARQMLESFTDYLRVSLAGLRREQTTLGAELDLARSYLALLQTRMEERLRYEIHCPEPLRAQPVPPLLLQPLVENAIHHGLEPQVDGGMVSVRARRDGKTLVLQVQDDGAGLQAPSRRRGNGVALDNLRQRLAAHWGGGATLTLADAQPGTCVTLRLPLSGGTGVDTLLAPEAPSPPAPPHAPA